MGGIKKVVAKSEFTDEDGDVLMVQKRSDGSVLIGAASAATREAASVSLTADQWRGLLTTMATADNGSDAA